MKQTWKSNEQVYNSINNDDSKNNNKKLIECNTTNSLSAINYSLSTKYYFKFFNINVLI